MGYGDRVLREARQFARDDGGIRERQQKEKKKRV